MSTNRKRTLAVIAGDIHRVEQANVFEIGDYLIEAKSICEHGDWLGWLWNEFEWSDTTAERFMNVARMGALLEAKDPNSATLRNLKLARTTLYVLCDLEGDKLPAIVDELAKHAKKTWLKAKDARRFIGIAQARIDHGDHPDATLWELSQRGNASDMVKALKAANPETDEAAAKIVNDVIAAREAAREAERAKREAEQDEVEPVEDEPKLEPEDEDEFEDDEAAARPTKPVRPPIRPQPMPGEIGPMLPDAVGSNGTSDTLADTCELIVGQTVRTTMAKIASPAERRQLFARLRRLLDDIECIQDDAAPSETVAAATH